VSETRCERFINLSRKINTLSGGAMQMQNSLLAVKNMRTDELCSPLEMARLIASSEKLIMEINMDWDDLQELE